MKRTFISIFIAGAILFTACNNDNKTQPTTEKVKDNSQTTASTSNTDGPTAESASSASVDPKTAVSLKPVIDHYLHVKNALVNDNGAEAAAGAKALAEAIDKIDQSALTPEQKKQYAEIAESLKEHAEHTSHNAGKIDHQREHFIGMSEDVEDLVKNFGNGRTLYIDHCPMANDNKGANWISETEEIKNPYMGKKMPKCGTLEKVVNQ